MRPIAIGRKNWLFVGSQRAGARAAVLASQVASCKNNLVESWAYLKNVYTRLADDPTSDQLTERLPDKKIGEDWGHTNEFPTNLSHD